MSSDLSEPAPSVPQTRRIGSGEAYRPASALVLCLSILLLTELGLNVLLGGMSLVEATVFADQIGEEEIVDDDVGMFYLGYGCLGILYLPVYLTCAVLFCVWAYRANRNARALGAQQMSFTPGWCVGWFFIPVANLFKPYQAIREIHQASDPEAGVSDWKQSYVSPALGWWWGLWIVSNILGNLEFRMSFSGEPDLMLFSAWLGVLGGVLAIPTALMAIHVVRGIHDRQEQKAAQPMAPASNPDDDYPAPVPVTHAAPDEREECPWCSRPVVRTIDGRCPACDRPI